MTSDKSYDNAQRIDALVARIAALESPSAFDIWHPLTSFAAGWSVGGFAQYTKLDARTVRVALQDLVLDGTATNKADGSTILTAANGLPSGVRPATNHRLPCYVDALRTGLIGTATEGAALQFQSDGSVQCEGIAAAATRVDFYADIPIDI